MKKTVSIIVTLCLFVGIFGITDSFAYAKENPEGFRVETQKYNENQKKQLKNANHVFSQKELKNTSYAGHQVELIEGKLYVDGKIVWSIVIWFYVKGAPVIAGWMAAGGLIKVADNFVIKSELRAQLKRAWNQFNNMTDAYAENQKLKSVKLSNGNQCVLAPTGTHFNCMYSE